MDNVQKVETSKNVVSNIVAAIIDELSNSIIPLKKPSNNASMPKEASSTNNNTAIVSTKTEPSTSNDKPLKEDAKSKKSKVSKKMRKWPSNLNAILPFKALIGPCKKVLDDGYRLIRKDKAEFEYEGFNIGRQERKFVPPPNYRLTKELLEYDKKTNNKSLFDVVLEIVFCLGIEQGRRISRPEYQSVNKLIAAMEIYRRDNRKLRYKLHKLDASIKLKMDLPDIPDDEFEMYLKAEVANGRSERLALAKKELGEDPTQAFRGNPDNRLVFSELVKIAKVVKADCSRAQWKDILKDNGWTMNEWKIKCKHKNVAITFPK